ncbi:MAG: pyridoxamine 5'-phosphate oxidase family protein [Haloplanus sp.]
MTAHELSRDEIDASLRDAGAGVLSLTDGGETYAVPESFGYDGDHIYFQSVYTDDSRKMAFIETTDLATLTVFTECPAESVIVRGRLGAVPDDEAIPARRAIAANATIPALNVSPDTPTEDLEFTLYRLAPEEISGRRFGPTGDLLDGA